MKNTFRQIKYNGTTFNVLGLPNTDIFKIEVLFMFGSNLEQEYELTYNKKIYGAMHLAEHLSFKSTKFYDTDLLLELMKKYGNRNASTGYSELRFFQLTTTKHSDFAIDAIIGTAFNDLSKVTPKEFKIERDIVINEVKEYYDKHNIMFYLNERSRLLNNDKDDNIIGSPEILNTVTLEDMSILKKAIMRDEDCRYINLIYDPEKTNETEFYRLLDNITKKIDILLPDRNFKHSLNLDRVNCQTKLNPEKRDSVFTDDSKESMISLFLDVEENYIVRYIGNIFTKELSVKNSLFNIIREDHGLAYGMGYSKYKLLDRDLTKFNITVTPGNEVKTLKLFKNILINMPNIYTRAKHDELIETVLLKSALSAPNLFNYTKLSNIATYYPNEFAILADIAFKDISYIDKQEYKCFCSYKNTLQYLKNIAAKIVIDDYIVIRNKKEK